MKRVLVLANLWLLLATLAFGQQAGSPSAEPTAPQGAQPQHYYTLNFVVREMNEGKSLTERSYTLGVAAVTLDGRDWWSLRAGTKVPSRNSYVDVGFNVDVRALDVGGSLQLRLKADLSSIPPDSAADNSTPPVRQMRCEEVVLVPVGRRTVVFSAEDPASKHHFELEVTAIRER